MCVCARVCVRVCVCVCVYVCLPVCASDHRHIRVLLVVRCVVLVYFLCANGYGVGVQYNTSGEDPYSFDVQALQVLDAFWC